MTNQLLRAWVTLVETFGVVGAVLLILVGPFVFAAVLDVLRILLTALIGWQARRIRTRVQRKLAREFPELAAAQRRRTEREDLVRAVGEGAARRELRS